MRGYKPTFVSIDWVPAGQGEPPAGVLLVATKYPDFPVWFGYFEDGQWFAPDATELEDVTHWMQLPKGPQ